MIEEMTVEEYHALLKNPRPHKYGAEPTVVDGIRFASKAEAHRYGELLLKERAGEIEGLELQPAFLIWQSGDEKIFYIADFKYIENGQVVVEDVKGVKTDVYRMKKKMFLAAYPEFKFVEVRKE
jgi:hypothetical protein